MAPGIYKTFKKSLKNSLYKFSEFFDYETAGNKSVFEEVSDYISSLLSKTYSELDTFLVEKSDVYKNLVEKYVYKIIKLAFEDTKKQTYQAMEGFVHNLNTLHSRAGAQVSNAA